jgi:hypothetical protein
MSSADDTRTVASDGDGSDRTLERGVAVTVHKCSPDRTVFTENDNTDGWIATDTTVDLCR